MATRAATSPSRPRTTEFDGIVMVEWSGLANGDQGEPVQFPACDERSVQVYGIFGAGGNLRIEGSLFDTAINFATLTDRQGNALDITGARIRGVQEATRWIRPVVTAGDASTALTVRLMFRKS